MAFVSIAKAHATGDGKTYEIHDQKPFFLVFERCGSPWLRHHVARIGVRRSGAIWTAVSAVLISKIIKAEEMKGKAGETRLIATLGKVGAQNVLLARIGRSQDRRSSGRNLEERPRRAS
jgi:hypothetical protein